MDPAEQKTYVAYYRVSTARQGASGLGLEAQRAAVHAFLKSSAVPGAEFTETESGSSNSRPKLAEAIAFARRHKAVLIIAKLDRLSRNAGFILTLRDSGVDFACADMPQANTLTIGIFAALAQHERELISARTKAALTAKKERGGWIPGTPANLSPEARKKGLEARILNARTHKANIQAAKLISIYREKGMSYRAIAAELNTGGYLTRRGRSFNPGTIKMLHDRILKEESLRGKPINMNSE
ncbi:MAG: recombinase family protein [Bacteroidota bacterium]